MTRLLPKASYGIKGDTQLVHVNKPEVNILQAISGNKTRNPSDHLRQFYDSDTGETGGQEAASDSANGSPGLGGDPGDFASSGQAVGSIDPDLKSKDDRAVDFLGPYGLDVNRASLAFGNPNPGLMDRIGANLSDFFGSGIPGGFGNSGAANSLAGLIGALLGGPLGAVAGSGLMSAVQGRPIGGIIGQGLGTLGGAALGPLGSYAGGKIGSALGSSIADRLSNGTPGTNSNSSGVGTGSTVSPSNPSGNGIGGVSGDATGSGQMTYDELMAAIQQNNNNPSMPAISAPNVVGQTQEAHINPAISNMLNMTGSSMPTSQALSVPAFGQNTTPTSTPRVGNNEIQHQMYLARSGASNQIGDALANGSLTDKGYNALPSALGGQASTLASQFAQMPTGSSMSANGLGFDPTTAINTAMNAQGVQNNHNPIMQSMLGSRYGGF